MKNKICYIPETTFKNAISSLLGIAGSHAQEGNSPLMIMADRYIKALAASVVEPAKAGALAKERENFAHHVTGTLAMKINDEALIDFEMSWKRTMRLDQAQGKSAALSGYFSL